MNDALKNIPLIHRFGIRCFILSGKEEEAIRALQRIQPDSGLFSLVVFNFKNELYVYFEILGGETAEDFPAAQEDAAGVSVSNTLLSPVLPYLEKWNDTYFLIMFDCYHNNRPRDTKQWKRNPASRKAGYLARLKPGRASEYIFYHYQLQEEAPGTGHKYGIIYVSENVLFFYKELPFAVEAAWYEGKLKTKNSPAEQWGDIMGMMFIPWNVADEEERIWRSTDLVYSYDKEMEDDPNE